MSLSELVPNAGIVADLSATSIKQVIHDLSEHAASVFDLDAHNVFDAVFEREKLGSTGLVLGVAVPHACIENMTEVKAIFARLSNPIDFDALDDRPVDLVFLLLAPADANAERLRALARITRVMKHEDYGNRLRGALGKDAIAALLAEPAIADTSTEKADTMD